MLRRGVRLWSIHPRHLDARGLVALWREGLLARAVLRGATRGYRHHPQLARFRDLADPVAAIDLYLHRVVDEADARGYRFDRTKLGPARRLRARPVTDGQLAHEWTHLLAKLRRRDPPRWKIARAAAPTPHPSFRIVAGAIATWERVAVISSRARRGRPRDRARRRAGA